MARTLAAADHLSMEITSTGSGGAVGWTAAPLPDQNLPDSETPMIRGSLNTAAI